MTDNELIVNNLTELAKGIAEVKSKADDVILIKLKALILYLGGEVALENINKRGLPKVIFISADYYTILKENLNGIITVIKFPNTNSSMTLSWD